MAFAFGCGGSPTSPNDPLWSRSGTGDSVFSMPNGVDKVRVTGSYTGHSSNFIIWIDEPRTLLVNELLGTGWGQTTYDGTLLTGGGGTVSVEKSSGVAWSLTEVR